MKLDVVIPFYNEEGCAKSFLLELLSALSIEQELTLRVFAVDDGSSDSTPVILDELAVNDKRVHAIHLRGNHGHQKALVAGLDRCDGDLVLMMDGDGQHPACTALEMIARFKANPDCDMIQAVRSGSQGGALKNVTSRFFYWMAQVLIADLDIRPGASDFRVLHSSVVQMFRRYPDRHRNVRLLLASLRLKTEYVPYEVAPRRAGSSKYSFIQMVRLAADGWFAFSMLPLRLSLLLMLGTGSIGMIYLVYVLWVYSMGRTVPGWTSIIASSLFLFCAVFAVLAIISEYVARIYSDVRGHPVYHVKDLHSDMDERDPDA